MLGEYHLEQGINAIPIDQRIKQKQDIGVAGFGKRVKK